MADSWTNAQFATYEFTVVNGLGQPTDLIDGVPITGDSNAAVATSSVAKPDGAGVGVYNLLVTGLTPSPDPTTPERSTVTIDADMTAGTDFKSGFVEYTITADGRLAAAGINFGAPAIADKA